MILRFALGGHSGLVRDVFTRDYEPIPHLLVSYVYLPNFGDELASYKIGSWALDSGAYSAINKGSLVTLPGYIDCVKACEDRMALPPSEVFALDVIGDWKKSLYNTERMWKQGIEAIPCFHQGEPWDVLLGLARDYPKIAIGGVVGVKVTPKVAWTHECFSRIWPKRVHGFGYSAAVSLLKAAPFDSVDASTWMYAPARYRDWTHLSRHSRSEVIRQHMRLERRDLANGLAREVIAALELQEMATWYWRKEHEELDRLFPKAA